MPDAWDDEHVGLIRLRGATRIDLLVRQGSKTFGAFPLVPTTPDPESDLRN